MEIRALRLNQTLQPAASRGGRLETMGAEIASGGIIPFLGPGLLGDAAQSNVPTTPEDLALQLHARVPVGAGLRGNMWGTAQFIEQRRHRKTLVGIMADIFKARVEPGPLDRWLARQAVPLIIDSWYAAPLTQAFKEAGRDDFVEVQGVTRALENRDVWTKCYGPDGKELAPEAAKSVRTVIYKPHGSVAPSSNFLVADSDYVEVLTEIDIQTPIPDVIKERRTGRGFIFIGCRFHDQMLRTYARQIMKRSYGPKYVVLDFEPTRMEERFLAEQGIEPLLCTREEAIDAIISV